MYIDLDRFKMVNDVLGHGAGDQVLVACARGCQRAAGDYAPSRASAATSSSPSRTWTRKPMRRTTSPRASPRRSPTPSALGDEEFAITASVGLACAPEHGEHPETLLNHADAAMYDAKRRGRSTWQALHPELARRAHEHAQIETQLRARSTTTSSTCVYQPVVALADGSVVGAEALIRWRHRSLGELLPDQFIAQAETTGDIVRIGNWVIRERAGRWAEWRRAGQCRSSSVAVNVSTASSSATSCRRRSRRARRRAPARLGAGARGDRARADRGRARHLGELRCAARARRRPGDRRLRRGLQRAQLPAAAADPGLKLSRSFLEGVPDNASDVAICEAVAGIARCSGCRPCARGLVETRASSALFLLRLGVAL
jgi:EAL domain-containing protein (putative c-di-GMP-specific phosphodiesterase class I)